MTKEDALEVTLREPKYIDCPDCSAKADRCLGCYGLHRVVNPEMVRACQVLGMEEPDDIAEEYRRKKNLALAEPFTKRGLGWASAGTYVDYQRVLSTAKVADAKAEFRGKS